MQHYQRNVTGVSKFCDTCGKLTLHRVDDRRVGSCLEHAPTGLSKAQEKRQKEKEEAEQQPALRY